MKFRKLRIAWSVACGLAAVLLIVLWVRSYSIADSLGGTTSAPRVLSARSCYGLLHILYFDDSAQSRRWRIESEPLTADDKQFEVIVNRAIAKLGFGLLRAGSDYELTFPYWIPLIGALLLASFPWVRWSKQYRLRTLLIATTLVAVMLGLIVWLRSDSG